MPVRSDLPQQTRRLGAHAHTPLICITQFVIYTLEMSVSSNKSVKLILIRKLETIVSFELFNSLKLPLDLRNNSREHL